MQKKDNKNKQININKILHTVIEIFPYLENVWLLKSVALTLRTTLPSASKSSDSSDQSKSLVSIDTVSSYGTCSRLAVSLTSRNSSNCKIIQQI